MKYKTALLLVTVLATSMATLFTACPEIEELQKSGGGGGNPRAGTGGTEPSITIKEGTRSGRVIISLIDPTDWGTRDNGTALTRDDVTFWLFYQEHVEDKDTIIKTVGRADVHTTKALRDNLIAPNTIAGVIQIVSGTPHPFEITGLAPNTSYSFFLRIIHPNTTTTRNVPRAHERTKYSRDTAVVQGKSKTETLADKRLRDAVEKLIEAAVAKAVKAAGREADEEAIRQAVGQNREVIEETVREAVEKTKGARGATGKDGERGTTGKDGDEAAVNALIKKTVDAAVAKAINKEGKKTDEKIRVVLTKVKLKNTKCNEKPWEPGQWCVTTLATGFNKPRGIAAAPDGTAFVSDTGNHQIKHIAPAGKVTTIAGSSTAGKADDIGTTKAQFDSPYGIAIDTTGNALYVTEYVYANVRIRRIALAIPYKVRTLAPDGFDDLKGIAIAPDGTALYVADSFSDVDRHQIKKLTLNADGSLIKSISIIAGKIDNAGKADGIGSKAQFSDLEGIAIAPDGTALYVADTPNNSIRKIVLVAPYEVSTLAPNGFNSPRGIAVAPDGKSLYVADTGNHRIKKLTLKADGSLKAITIIAGKIDNAGKADGIGTTAQFNNPYGIAAVSNTILYVADTDNNTIRKLEYKE